MYHDAFDARVLNASTYKYGAGCNSDDTHPSAAVAQAPAGGAVGRGSGSAWQHCARPAPTARAPWW